MGSLAVLGTKQSAGERARVIISADPSRYAAESPVKNATLEMKSGLGNQAPPRGGYSPKTLLSLSIPQHSFHARSNLHIPAGDPEVFNLNDSGCVRWSRAGPAQRAAVLSVLMGDIDLARDFAAPNFARQARLLQPAQRWQ